ncbi:MAG TPA: hypothetical protein VGF42_08440 [Caulobacteraceae bacterium]|jgi:hypothetical protein
MNILKATFLAALASCVALPAAASPAFDAFKKICGDTHTDFAAVKAALGGAGWTTTEVLPTNMEGVTPTEGIARTSTVGNERVSIYAWQGIKGQFHLTACTARVTQFQLAQAIGDAKTWLGFPPETDAKGKSTWRYGLTNGAWTPVKQADFQTAAGAGGLYFFNVFADHGEVVLDLLMIKS